MFIFFLFLNHMYHFQSYLKNLKKKQKEITKKHSNEKIKEEIDEKSCSGEGSGEEEEDSDLASIAR